MIAPMSDGPCSEVFAPGLLSGQVALVTGGGTGLGLATAVELTRCGAHVTICGRTADVLEAAVADRLGDPGRADWIAGDVRDRAGADRLVETVLERRGRLDILVNNAGGQYFTPAEAIVAKGWRAVWRLNVDGILNMARATVELAMGASAESAGARDAESPGAARETALRTGATLGGRGTGGKIINVTLSPHHGMPGMAHSGAARATVEALTRELALRWTDLGIAVTAVAAGHFDTEAMSKYPDTVRVGMGRSVPLQRLGRPEEHAWLVALLCSPVGLALNGSTVTLDGARDNWFGPWPPPGLVGKGGEVPVEARRPAPDAG
jgi:citronellol/citronellal dehydrogenase